MPYQWNPECTDALATVPAMAGRYLKLASPVQIQVLLWIATVGNGSGSPESCFEDLGSRVTLADCEDAFHFWEQEGILVSSEQSTIKTVKRMPNPTPDSTEDASLVLNESTVVQIPVVDSTPKTKEIIHRSRDHKQFMEILQTAEYLFGRPLNRADQNKLLDLFDTSNLAPETIMLALSYCARKGKQKIAYLVSTCNKWEEKGILTYEDADRELLYIERTEKCWDTVATWLSLHIEKPKVSDMRLAEKWVHQLELSEELVLFAFKNCMEACGEFKSSYMDKALSDWHKKGLLTLEDVQNAKKPKTDTPKKPKAVYDPNKKEGTGFDTAKYKEMLKKHRPKKKEGDS